MLECKTDQEMYEIMLAIISNSAYGKVISRTDKYGKLKDNIGFNWDLTIAEEQQFEPIASHPSENIMFNILFSKKSQFVGYIPIIFISEH